MAHNRLLNRVNVSAQVLAHERPELLVAFCLGLLSEFRLQSLARDTYSEEGSLSALEVELVSLSRLAFARSLLSLLVEVFLKDAFH